MISRTIRLALLSCFVVVSAGRSFADEKSIKLAECPDAVRKTLEREANGAKIDLVTKETEEGVTAYWVRVVIGGRMFQIRVDDKGTLVEMDLEVADEEVKFSACPAAVQATFRKESGNAKFDDVGKDIKYGMIVYDAVATIAGKEYSFVVGENGTLVEKMLIVAEDEIELSHCPAAVQQALKEHTRGGKIDNVMRSTGIGGQVYEADLEIGGKNYFIEVTEGGGLISKSLVVGEADGAAKGEKKDEPKKSPCSTHP